MECERELACDLPNAAISNVRHLLCWAKPAPRGGFTRWYYRFIHFSVVMTIFRRGYPITGASSAGEVYGKIAIFDQYLALKLDNKRQGHSY